jgi:hypothetical protein
LEKLIYLQRESETILLNMAKMKNFPLLLLFIVLLHSCRNQTNLITQNDNIVFEEADSRILNEVFISQRGDFDFCNKRVLFMTGSSGRKIATKENYIQMINNHKENERVPIDTGKLYVFENSRNNSFGYDAAIVFWCKSSLSEEDVIRNIKRLFSSNERISPQKK